MFTEKRPDCLYGLNIIQSGQSAPWAELVYFKKMSFLIQKSRGTIAQVRARAENRTEILRVIRIFCARAQRARTCVSSRNILFGLCKKFEFRLSAIYSTVADLSKLLLLARIDLKLRFLHATLQSLARTPYHSRVAVGGRHCCSPSREQPFLGRESGLCCCLGRGDV